MTRRRTPGPDATPSKTPAATPPHVVHPTAVYTVDQAQRAFRLKVSTIRREVREGRLRIAKRAGRYYLLGRWLIEWLESGEVRRQPGGPRRAEVNDGQPSANAT